LTSTFFYYIILAMKLNTKKLLREMKQQKISPAELARRSGMTRQAVDYAIERESTKLVTLTVWGEILGIDPKDLLI